VPAKHYCDAQTQRSLVHFAIGSQTMPLAIAEPFRAHRLYAVIAFAFLESLVLLAAAVNRFWRHCVERLAANRKRIDELMRLSLMLVTACAKDRLRQRGSKWNEPAGRGTRLGARQRRGARCAGSPGSDAGARRLNSIRQPAEVNAKEQENSHQTAIDNEGPCRKSFKNAQQAPDRGKSR
jgi:hypothetical protein